MYLFIFSNLNTDLNQILTLCTPSIGFWIITYRFESHKWSNFLAHLPLYKHMYRHTTYMKTHNIPEKKNGVSVAYSRRHWVIPWKINIHIRSHAHTCAQIPTHVTKMHICALLKDKWIDNFLWRKYFPRRKIFIATRVVKNIHWGNITNVAEMNVRSGNKLRDAGTTEKVLPITATDILSYQAKMKKQTEAVHLQKIANKMQWQWQW